MQCVGNCDAPDPRQRHLFEREWLPTSAEHPIPDRLLITSYILRNAEPVWQSATMFLGEIFCGCPSPPPLMRPSIRLRRHRPKLTDSH